MRIRQIVFRLGGVLYPDLAALILAAAGDPGKLPGSSWQQIHTFSRMVSFGRLEPKKYLEQVCGLAGMSCAAEELRLRIIAGKAEGDMCALLEELSGRFRLSLICDYPAEWLAASRGWPALQELFLEPELFHQPQAGLQTESAWYHNLINRDLVTPGASLLIDHDSTRTALVLRAGLDAGIFVSPSRLRRDLGLWSILQSTV